MLLGVEEPLLTLIRRQEIKAPKGTSLDAGSWSDYFAFEMDVD